MLMKAPILDHSGKQTFVHISDLKDRSDNRDHMETSLIVAIGTMKTVRECLAYSFDLGRLGYLLLTCSHCYDHKET